MLIAWFLQICEQELWSSSVQMQGQTPGVPFAAGIEEHLKGYMSITALIIRAGKLAQIKSIISFFNAVRTAYVTRKTSQ